MLVAPLLLALGCCDDLQLQTELNNQKLTFPYAKINSYTECTENVPGMISDDFANKFASGLDSEGELLETPTNQNPINDGRQALTDFFCQAIKNLTYPVYIGILEDNDKYFTSLLVERKSIDDNIFMGINPLIFEMPLPFPHWFGAYFNPLNLAEYENSFYVEGDCPTSSQPKLISPTQTGFIELTCKGGDEEELSPGAIAGIAVGAVAGAGLWVGPVIRRLKDLK